jgi:hypothetical protein
MSDIDEIVRRAVGTITTIAAKAAAFSTRLLLGTFVVCVGSFALGVAALDGGIESVWIVLGIVFGSIAIGSAVVARWRAGSVRRHAPELADEVRNLVTDGRDSTRTVVETFVIDPDADQGDTGSAIVLTRRMSGFQGAMGGSLERSPRLGAAVKALTSFPLLVLAAVAISLVFAFVGFLFLIALAL